jgi:hypothetical protein
VSASAGRQRRAQSAAASKARRQKKLVAAGLVVLAVVLAIQVPRTLKQLGGESASPTAASTPTPTAAAPTPAADTDKTSKELKSLIAVPPGDPFATRAISGREVTPSTSVSSNLRDPFGASRANPPAQPTPTPAPRIPARIVIGTPRAGRTARVGYIVVLASVPTREGSASAARTASRARSQGIAGVAVLQSSTRKTLRAGYYVVYVGPYKSQGSAMNAAAGIHARGFRDAYIRELVRY